MLARIGRLQIRYRIPRGSDAAANAIPALDRICARHVPWVCEEALQDTLGDDPTVYVIRKVSHPIAVLTHRLNLEENVARQWGRRLAASVIRKLAHDSGGGEVARFENQAEFVSRFLGDLVTGRAWDAWFYGAFRCYKDLPLQEAIFAVLDDNREHLSEILRRLQRRGSLDAVLALLDEQRRKAVWVDLLPGRRQAAADSLGVIVQAAVAIADRLQLWKNTRPSESAIIAAYLKGDGPAPRWKGREDLADSVADVIAFLADEALLDSSSAPAAFIEEDIKWFVDTFDWLDGSRLAERVQRMLRPVTSHPARVPAVLRPFSSRNAGGVTLVTLAAALREGLVRFDGADDAGHANLLRLLSACAEGSSETEGARIRRSLETALQAASAAVRSTEAARQLASALRALQTGSIAPPDLVRQGSKEIERAIRAGEDVVLFATELAKQLRSTAGGTQLSTRCAGLFLLIRGLQDVRLGAALHESGCTLQPVLTTLAIAFAGEDVWDGKSFDAGAALWAGIEPLDAAAHIAALGSMPLAELAAALTSNIEGQRLVDPAEQAQWDAAPELPAAIVEVARLVLRSWARWLPGLSASSIPYLLQNFVRRGGSLHVDREVIEVHLNRAPLDSILRMSGYLADLAPPWLENRAVRFRLSSRDSQ